MKGKGKGEGKGKGKAKGGAKAGGGGSVGAVARMGGGDDDAMDAQTNRMGGGGRRRAQNRIINGRKSESHYPWMVKIVVKEGACGGALVTNQVMSSFPYKVVRIRVCSVA